MEILFLILAYYNPSVYYKLLIYNRNNFLFANIEVQIIHFSYANDNDIVDHYSFDKVNRENNIYTNILCSFVVVLRSFVHTIWRRTKEYFHDYCPMYIIINTYHIVFVQLMI